MKTTSQELKIGDIVGNTVQGFRFQIIEINFNMDRFYNMKVQNISTFEIFETTSDNMYLHGTRKY